MLEEKNDNLQDADGNQINESQEVTITENQEIPVEAQEENEPVQEAGPSVSEAEQNTAPETEETVLEEIAPKAHAEVAVLTEELTEDEIEVAAEREALVEEAVETVAEPEAETAQEIAEAAEDSNASEQAEQIQGASEVAEAPSEENAVVLTDEQVADDSPVIEDDNESVINAIAEVNAEESEDETIKDRHDIPMLDYEALSMEELVDELAVLVTVEKLMSVKDHVEELKKSFLSKYYHFIDEKKEEFHAENPETTEDFHYHFPLKVKFDQLYTQYREKKNNHFQSLQNSLKSNLENRLAIVEELKNLIHSQDSIPVTLKKFNDIRDRWKVAGPIPKDKYNHVWNNYHFHLENFYDVLHLDREIRDLDFKHNLVQKLKIIERVEELVKEEDINKSFRELQDLHRIWKEDIGPVSRENREEIWNRFSELTKQMHDKREGLYEQFREVEKANLEKKKEIIAQIEVLAQEKVGSHSAWLGQIEKVEALRNQFFGAGKVPAEVTDQTWNDFKNAVRSFNVLKNSFYKDIKKDQNDNLSKKQALVAKANELKESTDFGATTPIFKQIQEEWKTIGHVPRKFSDKLWAEFRAACNEYFEKLKEQKTEVNSEELEAFENKKAYLETIKGFELVGDHKTDLDAIKAHIETWKGFGKVPFARRHIEGKFNKILDSLFEKLSSSKKDNEMVRYANRLDNLAGSDTRRLDNEKVFIMRKIDEVQSNLFQLENNIQFFAKAKSDNPMVKEVMKNIEKQKEELATWKEKLKQLRSIKTEE
jgi:cell division FtsZ-interacting protein ZapD